MPEFASLFQKGEEKEDADATEEVEEEEAEDEEEEQEEAAEGEVERELGWALGGNILKLYRPKACEMVGFGNNWDTEDIIGQHRMQGDRSIEKAKEGGNSGEEEEVQSHQWDEEGRRIVEVVEEEADRIVAAAREEFAEVEERIRATGVGEEKKGKEDERQPRPISKPAVEMRWILETTSDRPDGVPDEEEQQEGKEGFRQAFTRNIRAEVTRRKGARTRISTKFFDEVQAGGKKTTNDATEGGGTKKIGERKRYGSSNVRTLAMKGDRNRKETCEQVAAAVEWVIEFEERGLGIIGLQECRIPSGMDGCEGEYRTYYSGNVDGKRQHGVGIFMHNTVTQGEFDIQPINERIMWIYGMVFGVMQAVFAVYAPTNKKDNLVEVDAFYRTLEQQVKEVRTKYGLETKIIILGDFNARIGTDGAGQTMRQKSIMAIMSHAPMECSGSKK